MSDGGIAVNFFTEDIEGKGLPVKLLKELKVVQEIRNTTKIEKVNGKYVGSPTNKALNDYRELSIRLISGMVDQGLSFASGDYYVYVQFGGKPSVTKSPNGMIKAMSKLASKSGFIANINTGCIFEGYTELTVTRNGIKDSLHLINLPEAEVGDAIIISPFAVVTLISRETGATISRKVIIVRNNEYEAAKKQGGYTHKTYPVPMAQKIALRRAAEEMAASLGIDDSAELAAVKKEIKDHDKDYVLDNYITEDQAKKLLELADTGNVDLGGLLHEFDIPDVNSLPSSKYEKFGYELNKRIKNA